MIEAKSKAKVKSQVRFKAGSDATTEKKALGKPHLSTFRICAACILTSHTFSCSGASKKLLPFVFKGFIILYVFCFGSTWTFLLFVWKLLSGCRCVRFENLKCFHKACCLEECWRCPSCLLCLSCLPCLPRLPCLPCPPCQSCLPCRACHTCSR